MFGWLKKKKEYNDYEFQVLTNVMALTTLVEDNSLDQIRQIVPGLDGVIHKRFEEDKNPYPLALELAGIIMTETINQFDANVRQLCIDQLDALMNGEELGRGEEVLPFVNRILFMGRQAEKLESAGVISGDDNEMLVSEVIGALKGIDREERMSLRIFQKAIDMDLV